MGLIGSGLRAFAEKSVSVSVLGTYAADLCSVDLGKSIARLLGARIGEAKEVRNLSSLERLQWGET